MNKKLSSSRKKASYVSLQLPAESLPVLLREPHLQADLLGLVAKRVVVGGHDCHAHEGVGGVLAAEGRLALDFLLQELDDLLGGVLLEEEREDGLVLIEECAESGVDDFLEVGVHHVLDGEVEKLLEDGLLVYLFLDGGVVHSEVAQQDDELVEEHFGDGVFGVLFELVPAVGEHEVDFGEQCGCGTHWQSSFLVELGDYFFKVYER